MWCITPGAPAMLPKYLSGLGTVSLAGNVATACGKNRGSVVAPRTNRAYPVSNAACARDADGGADGT